MTTHATSDAYAVPPTYSLSDMSKDERSLLVFFETCVVDQNGRVKIPHMNADDMEIAARWTTEGFVTFGRICAEDIGQASWGTHSVTLSDEAWTLAHAERRARAARSKQTRTYHTTAEKRAEGA
jgi:hypothetical protein